mgnify:CR=1 FL=1
MSSAVKGEPAPGGKGGAKRARDDGGEGGHGRKRTSSSGGGGGGGGGVGGGGGGGGGSGGSNQYSTLAQLPSNLIRIVKLIAVTNTSMASGGPKLTSASPAVAS